MASSTISSKGQITVPIEVRRRLGLKPGDRVVIALQDDLAVIRPVKAVENPFAKDIGLVPAFGTIDKINAWISEMRGRGPDFPD